MSENPLKSVLASNGLRAGLLLLTVSLVLVYALNIFFAFGSVGEGAVAVETNFGESTETVYESGRFWTGNPLLLGGFTHGVDRLNVEPVTLRLQVEEGLSQDGQDIDATVSVTYQLDKDQAVSFYTDSEQSGAFTGGINQWESRVGERAITSAVQDASASVSALEIVEEFDSENATDIQSLRAELQSEVEEQLRAENQKVSPEINIIEIRVERVELSQELNSGLEDIAVERAEAERQIVDAQADAQAERERAQGEADAFREILEAYGGVDEALQSEYIDAIRQDDGTIVLGGSSDTILDLGDVARNETGDGLQDPQGD